MKISFRRLLSWVPIITTALGKYVFFQLGTNIIYVVSALHNCLLVVLFLADQIFYRSYVDRHVFSFAVLCITRQTWPEQVKTCYLRIRINPLNFFIILREQDSKPWLSCNKGRATPWLLTASWYGRPSWHECYRWLILLAGSKCKQTRERPREMQGSY